MNTKMLKGMTAAVSLLTGIGAASPAMAGFTGAQVLANNGASPTIDVWTFTGPAGFGGRARVSDLANPNNAPAVQVVLGHDSGPNLQVTDATDNNVFSAFTPVIPESGLYAMAFKKTGPDFEIYNGHGQCVNAAGGIFEPALTRRIRQ